MDAPSSIPVDVARITGPLLIGYLLDWGLFGVLCMQVYIYYLAFSKDPIFTRGLVYGIFLFMLVQTVLLSQSAFRTFGAGFGNLELVDDITHIWFSVPIMSAIVALLVQGYYAFQIMAMSKDNRIGFVIACLATTQLVGGIFTGAIGHGAVRFSHLSGDEESIATGVWNGAGALSDIIIATCMVHYYTGRNSKWKLKPNGIPLILRIIVLSGGLLATIAVANTVLSLLPHGQTYFQSTSGILGNSYANTLMAFLNSRVRLSRPTTYANHEHSDTSSTENGNRVPRLTALVFAPLSTEAEGGTIMSTGQDMDLEIARDRTIRIANFTNLNGTEKGRTLKSVDFSPSNSLESTPNSNH